MVLNGHYTYHSVVYCAAVTDPTSAIECSGHWKVNSVHLLNDLLGAILTLNAYESRNKRRFES